MLAVIGAILFFICAVLILAHATEFLLVIAFVAAGLYGLHLAGFAAWTYSRRG